MITYEQVPLAKITAKRALDSGAISAEMYREIMEEIEKVIRARKKKDDIYRNAIKQMVIKQKLPNKTLAHT